MQLNVGIDRIPSLRNFLSRLDVIPETRGGRAAPRHPKRKSRRHRGAGRRFQGLCLTPFKTNAIQLLYPLTVHLASSSLFALCFDPLLQSRVLGLKPIGHRTVPVMLLKLLERFKLVLPLGVVRIPDKA
jgi:hypothetical protein